MKGWGKRIFVMTWFEQFVLIFISETSVSLVDLPFLWQAFEEIVLVVRRPSGQLGKNKAKEGLLWDQWLWDQCDQIIPPTLLQLQCEQWSGESRILNTSELFVSSILAIQELLFCSQVECGWATLRLLDWYLFVFVFVFVCLYLLPSSQWGRGAIWLGSYTRERAWGRLEEVFILPPSICLFNLWETFIFPKYSGKL